MITPATCGLRQFICWRLQSKASISVTGEAVTTSTKVPVSPHTGQICNPHDPNEWVDYQTAASKGQVAFVLTAADPYFFVDLDKCKTDLGWSPEATMIAQAFAGRGAFLELSQSGTGLHVLGTMAGMGVEILRNKWDGWKEFYFKERFVALGTEWQGSMNVDCTDLVYQIVPQRDAAELAETPAERDPDWSGPEDDAELVARMLASSGGAGAAFGQKAHVRDLWTADRLERFWPIPEPRQDGALFDWSVADAALMAHLAFWTGRDAPRMDRLFRQSALMREKYEKRAGYRNSTTIGAIRGCRSVYTGGTRSSVGEGSSAASGDPQQDNPETIDLSRIEQYFSGCVYIQDRHAVLLPSGHIVKPEQFRAIYGGHRFVVTRYEGTPVKDAFEAFTQNRAMKFPQVWSTCFKPEHAPYAIIDTQSGPAVNMFAVPEIPTSDEEPIWFLDLLTRMIPNERDRDILLSWMAFCVQHRGTKALWAVVLQGVEGNGKSFIRRALQYAIGDLLTHCPTAEDMQEKYNNYIEHNLLIAVEEVHMDGRRSMMDRLKPLITEDQIEIRAMGRDKYMADNLTNWFFTTNHQDAVIKTRNDRRYAIFFGAQQNEADLMRDGLTAQYFKGLWTWAKAGGFAAIAGYLNRYVPNPDFDPAQMAIRAPYTSTTEAAIRESMGSMEAELLVAIDEGQAGFRNGWISSVKAVEILSRVGRTPTRRTVGNVIKNLGYEKMGKTAALFHEGGSQVTVYRKPSDGVKAPADYAVDQGYAV